MKGGDGAGVNAFDAAEQPQQEIDGVNTLIHKGSASVEVPRSAPVRSTVILWRAIPLHPCVHEDRFSDSAGLYELFEFSQVRFCAVLENYTKLDSGFPARMDESINSIESDIDRFLNQDM